MYPFWTAFQPKKCCVNSGKTASIAVKATVKIKLMTTNRATAGFRSTHLHPASTPPIPRLVKGTVTQVDSVRRVSGRKRSTSRALASATSIATQKGTAGPRGANRPPRAGPTTNPNPIAAPIMPMPRARLSTGVTSATTACAEPIFEAPRPPMKRATNKIANEPASAESANESASINSEARMTGLRPYRSERVPSTGVKMNCASAYIVRISPTPTAPAPSLSAQKGSKGRTIPKPAKSMKMVSAMKYTGERPVRFITYEPMPVLFKTACLECLPQANTPHRKSLVLCGCWLCRFLLNVQCRMLALEDMEKEPERGQEQSHTNKSANKQRQQCGRWTGCIVNRHSNRDQVGKLRQPPGSKNEGRYGKGQHTNLAAGHCRSGCPEEERCDSAGGTEHAAPDPTRGRGIISLASKHKGRSTHHDAYHCQGERHKERN